jgi:hypothetical protein
MSSTRAIIKITALGKSGFLINYSRRMYAIVRRYTPEGLEGDRNECYADITGLRTFYKKTYKELTDSIVKDIESEVGIICAVHPVTVDEYEGVKNTTAKKEQEYFYLQRDEQALCWCWICPGRESFKAGCEEKDSSYGSIFRQSEIMAIGALFWKSIPIYIPNNMTPLYFFITLWQYEITV